MNTAGELEVQNETRMSDFYHSYYYLHVFLLIKCPPACTCYFARTIYHNVPRTIAFGISVCLLLPRKFGGSEI